MAVRLIKVPLARLEEQSARHPDGYVAALIQIGSRRGPYLEIEEGKWMRMRERFGLAKPAGRARKGLGDRIHALALPFARLLDGFLGTKLTKCRACARRRHWLNRLGAWARGIWDAGRSLIRRLIGR